MKKIIVPWEEEGNGGGGGGGGPPTTAGDEPPEATAVPGYGGGATLDVDGDDIMLERFSCDHLLKNIFVISPFSKLFL